MHKLIAELTRLYLPAGTVSPEVLEQNLSGPPPLSISLVTGDGRARAMAIAFDKLADSEEAQHWSLLCVVANALQAQLGLPAPAVSISGAHGYRLWLSFEVPVPTALAQTFLELLHKAYFPGMHLAPDAASAPVELPPCLHQGTGMWAAFINPGLGASFSDEAGLEMAPPFAGQAALLEGLKSISEPQFLHAMKLLHQSHGAATTVSEPASAPMAERASVPPGLLLKDATLEDIVRYLHSKNIEPTFRHLIRDR